VPPWVRVQEPFDIEVTMQSSKTNRAHLVVMRNAVPIGERSITLKAGLNVVTLSEQVTKPGLYEYEAVINSDDDGVNENNRYQAFVQVRGEPRVLHAVGEAGWGRHVTQALRKQGLLVEEVLGTALPTTLHGLSDYDLVVLNNVSGFDVSIAKMELLEDYVRNAGGGVISLGGDKSYSAGGYYGTPVEELLPVTMDIKTEAKIPTLAVTIVMDRSGSMATNGKLVIAKAAAMAAVEVLNPLDQVSVLAFDDAPEWSVPPSEVGNRRAIVDQLRMVTSGGGTDLFLALQEAYAVMVSNRHG
jgi:Ca-activated chloride channel family protein